MASEKTLNKKQVVIDEIKDVVSKSSSIVLFSYRGLTDEQTKELRRKLRETNSEYKVYKNTLMERAFNDLKIDVEGHLKGSSALAYGEDAIAPIKVLADFSKKNTALVLKVGVIDGEIAEEEKLEKLSKIPSREGLLTMLASGMIEIPKKLSICLDLYAKQK